MTPTLVDNKEMLASYVTDKEEISIIGEQVRGDLFVPTRLRPDARLEHSVVRYGSRTEEQMQLAGKEWGKHFKKAYVGFARILTNDIRDVHNLNVEHTPRPKWELLHSDIIDWFPEEPRYRIQAELVARKARFLRAS